MNYTVIDHDVRMRIGISINEYCVVDKVHHLADNPTGWCFASRQKLGDLLGFSKVSIIAILKAMATRGLLEFHPETRHIRTTPKWYENFTAGKDSLPVIPIRIGKESLPNGKETLPPSPQGIGKDSLLTGKDSLPTGEDSLPGIGKESLPPSERKIFLEIERELEIEEEEDAPAAVQNVVPIFVLKNRQQLTKEVPSPQKVAQKSSPPSLDEYHQSMAASPHLIESACMKNGISPEECLHDLAEFILEKKGEAHTPKDDTDIRRHFLSWMRIRYELKKNQKLNTSNPHGNKPFTRTSRTLRPTSRTDSEYEGTGSTCNVAL